MALGDLHVFTGEEYVDTELAPLLNENFNSLKKYVDDASRWQVMPVQFKGTNAKFLIHETTLGTGTTQILPLVVLNNTDIAKFSACSLKVVMSTKNGSIAAVNCDISLQKVHNSNECNVNFNTTNSDDAKAEPCTFTYNNIKYAGLKLTTGNADTLWVSGYTTEEWTAPVVATSVTNLVTLGSDMNVIPTLFKSLQTDKSPVNDYDVVNKKSLNDLTNIKTYSQLSQIGLSGGVLDNSPYAIGNALPANSMLIVGITGKGNTYKYPKTSGQLVVIRSNSNRVYYEVQGNSGSANIENYVGLYIIDQVSTGTVLTWKRILTDVDTGYWQPNETVTNGTVRKLVGKQYAGCFLVCKVAGTTGSTQPSPDPADGAGIGGGGSGSITFYGSLEEIGITPGQESFASIHSALPINSVLEYTKSNLNTYNEDFYPASYGLFRATKLNSSLTFFEYLQYTAENRSGSGADTNTSNNICMTWATTYNSSYPNVAMTWNKALSTETEATQAIRGGLQIKRPTDYAQINIIASNNRERRLDCGVDYLRLSVMTDKDTSVGGRFITLSTANSLSNSFYLQENISGTWTSYNLFGQHNIATQAEAVAGTINTKPMTPLRVKQAINAFIGNALPTGSIFPFAGGTIPSGFLACNGAAVSRTTYAALYNAIGTTYGTGDGSTTFNVPQIEDNRFLEFSSTRGSKRNAGLPNITGNITNTYQFGNVGSSGTVLPTTTGAFSISKSSKRGTSGENSYSYNIHFNAKNSNAIYGASTTVQPKSLTVRAIIKY